MRDIKNVMKALENGMAIDNDMAIIKERGEIELEYERADVYAKAYNHFSKSCHQSENEIFKKYMGDELNRMKYKMYYPDWDY